jgi:hypothetical protein
MQARQVLSSSELHPNSYPLLLESTNELQMNVLLPPEKNKVFSSALFPIGSVFKLDK